jgi:hypothetical protein
MNCSTQFKVITEEFRLISLKNYDVTFRVA